MISPADRHPRARVSVRDSEMSYVDTGLSEGISVVFLHGNPTSSYLWRNVLTEVEDVAHCLAPDLIGMGESGKNPSGSYRFADHASYLDAWFDTVLPAGDIVLVVHDWGSALGFHWARRHPQRVQGIAYMEAIVRPMAWEEFPAGARRAFHGLRSPAGEAMILEKNFFVERILPASVQRSLSKEEMEVYRRPYLETGESRRPTLTWPREIPLDGQPGDVVEIVDNYASWLAANEDLPKLFINAEPGSILCGAQREFCRAWPNQTEITVPGIHFVQEDSPVEIGQAVRSFVASSLS